MLDLINKGIENNILVFDKEDIKGKITPNLLRHIKTNFPNLKNIYISPASNIDNLEAFFNMCCCMELSIHFTKGLEYNGQYYKYFLEQGGQLFQEDYNLIIGTDSDGNVILGSY